MAVTRTLACPDCKGTFSWLFMSEDDWPTHCARCGNYMGEDEPQVIPGAPAIGGSALARSADQTYREIERTSQLRAEAAGDPSLKVTNMKDNLREGDVAGIAPNNDVTKYAGETGHQFFQGGGIGIADALAASKVGRTRTTGEVALRAIQGGAAPNFAPPAPSGGLKGGFGGNFG